jgi:hypothetical protein
MPLLRHLLARFSANPLPIITKRVSPLRKPTHGAKSGLGSDEPLRDAIGLLERYPIRILFKSLNAC